MHEESYSKLFYKRTSCFTQLKFNFPSLARLHICAAIRRESDCSVGLWKSRRRNWNWIVYEQILFIPQNAIKITLKSTRNLSNWNMHAWNSVGCHKRENVWLVLLSIQLLSTAVDRFMAISRRWSIGNLIYFPFSKLECRKWRSFRGTNVLHQRDGKIIFCNLSRRIAFELASSNWKSITRAREAKYFPTRLQPALAWLC